MKHPKWLSDVNVRRINENIHLSNVIVLLMMMTKMIIYLFIYYYGDGRGDGNDDDDADDDDFILLFCRVRIFHLYLSHRLLIPPHRCHISLSVRFCTLHFTFHSMALLCLQPANGCIMFHVRRRLHFILSFVRLLVCARRCRCVANVCIRLHFVDILIQTFVVEEF